MNKKLILLPILIIWLLAICIYVTVKMRGGDDGNLSLVKAGAGNDHDGLSVDASGANANSAVVEDDATIESLYLNLKNSKTDEQKQVAAIILANTLYVHGNSSQSIRSDLIKNIPDGEKASKILNVISRDGSAVDAVSLVDSAEKMTSPFSRRACMQTAYLLNKAAVGERVSLLVRDNPAQKDLLTVIQELGYGK